MSICGGQDKPCATCALAGGCLAGLRDDDYIPARKEQVIERLDAGRYTDYHRAMKEYLLRNYLYNYDTKQQITFK